MPKRLNSGRKKTSVKPLFIDVKSDKYKGKRVKCIFCSEELPDNGTRLKNHIMKCKKCHETVKMKYLYTQEKHAELPERDEDMDSEPEIADIIEYAREQALLSQAEAPECPEVIPEPEERSSNENIDSMQSEGQLSSCSSTPNSKQETPSVASFFNVTSTSVTSPVPVPNTSTTSATSFSCPKLVTPQFSVPKKSPGNISTPRKLNYGLQSEKLNKFLDNVTDKENVSICLSI